ncbi:MAG: insulinase family protein, partial [Melioribacteraceae bacterium]|nr:insulinase family protein [Melioribacteraceae bacterium]
VSLDYKYKLKNRLKEDKKLIKRTGESPKASVSLVYQQSDTIGFLPKRDLENVVVKDIIRSRLLKELREEMGAVYSVGVSSSSTLQPSDLSRQSINFLCEPQRAQELIKKTKGILSQLASQEISIEEDLNKIKTNLLKVDNLLRQRNTYWTKAIREHYFNKYPNWNAVVNYQERVQALDEGEIADRIKAYFIDSPTIEAILYPKETNL